MHYDMADQIIMLCFFMVFFAGLFVVVEGAMRGAQWVHRKMHKRPRGATRNRR